MRTPLGFTKDMQFEIEWRASEKAPQAMEAMGASPTHAAGNRRNAWELIFQEAKGPATAGPTR
jgi:hypothetical protein